MEFNYQDIKRLAEILRPTEEDSDSEDDLPQSGLSALGNVIKHGLITSPLFIISHIIPMYKSKAKKRIVKFKEKSYSFSLLDDCYFYFLCKYMR
jgi:hypothetical protein